MNRIATLVNVLKQEWGHPREAVHRGERCPFLLVCRFEDPRAQAIETFPFTIPEDVRQFWLETNNATLFKDEQYGQWGVEVLGPTQALAETSRQSTARPKDFNRSDLILARFFGDLDLLVIACDPAQDDFGTVTIALPIDKRCDWPVVARSFSEFLEKLLAAQGDKYWEVLEVAKLVL
jgi:hypothetical protein